MCRAPTKKVIAKALDNMRNQQNQRRNRGRNNNNNNRGGQNNGYRPSNNGMNDSRARGNAQQLLEKYKNMARDAATSGDRVLAEYYMQHADHYFRIVSEFRARFEENRPRDQRGDGDQSDDQGGNSDNYIEGVDAMDLRRPQSFAASVAVQSVGADSAPTPPAPRLDDDRDEDAPRLPPKIHASPRREVAETGSDDVSGSPDGESESSGGEDRTRRRGRRIRLPRIADAPTETVEG
jgi:Domain of unknown function (DUF4167)